MDAGLAGVVGAGVGGLFTLLATIATGLMNKQAAKQADNALVVATALLMQDDFYHFQVTLARALDACAWWTEAQVLRPQATVSDRKTVWAALPGTKIGQMFADIECFAYLQLESGDFPSQAPDTIANAVADAQGWMQYLTQRRKAADEPPAASDFETMKRVFALLDIARRSLQQLAKREATDFTQSNVFDTLTCKSVHDLLNRQCAERGGRQSEPAVG